MGAQAPTPIDVPPRSASALSHTRPSLSVVSSLASRTGSSVLRPYPVEKPLIKPSEVVPSATYIERGSRWMEKEEVVSLREAMEDMDLKAEDEESRLQLAAQNEASELVWQHQNPDSLHHPDAPYSYKEHLRKNSYAHARTQSVGRYGGIGLATGLARDISPRTISMEFDGIEGSLRDRRALSGCSVRKDQDHSTSPEALRRQSSDSARSGSTITYDVPTIPRTRDATRRRSGGKRNVSGERLGSFRGDQIWEEPERSDIHQNAHANLEDIPAPLKIKARNPLNRVQFAADLPDRSSSTAPEPIKKFSKYEIHRNPPSQSRNPTYTANPVPGRDSAGTSNEGTPEKLERDSLEIRSDEIRQATSMRLKDRSPKLPTPTAVSDRLGRPIVSFDANWKPKEADDKPEERKHLRFGARPFGQRENLSSRPHPKPFPDIQTQRAAVPTTELPESLVDQSATYSRSDIPAINIPEPPQISVSAPAVPCINITEPGQCPSAKRPLPGINLPQASASSPVVPTINVSNSDQKETKRPLPDPKTSSRPPPKHQATAPASRGHWSPVFGARATASCHQCQLPIQGRVVALRGVSERFHPECFICFSCGTGLEALEISPEPDARRNERLDRIRRRGAGEQLEEIEGQTMAEDGDERLRFYCHLDWHENFAPRCKHCKTPIIGEHAVALGEHWHYGHFFCAECGDPFEQGMTHIEKDGYAWCLRCQTKRTERRAPKCKKCKGPVIGQYVQALGGEWHDECFRCKGCKSGFDDGQIFPKDVDGETVVLCTRCMERELKA